MRPFVLAILLLSAATSLAAFEIVPPAPDSHTYVRVVAITSNCVPLTTVTVSGQTIVVEVGMQPGWACIAEASAPATANIGVLPPGVYQIVIRQKGGTDLEKGTLVVRDADSGILVSPVGAPADGRRTVQIYADPPLVSTSSVTFDGMPATIVGIGGGTPIVVMAPPHGPGTVDVEVHDESGTRKAAAAFTYFDPAAPPDPFVFEPLLFPVAYDGHGEFGSQWQTDNALATGNTLVRLRQPVPVKGRCTGDCTTFNWSALLAPQSQSGLLLWVVRRRLPLGVTDDFRASSRITELSRPGSPSTGLPIGRERDFRTSFIIQDVPLTRSATRVTLRLYALGDVPTTAAVTLTPNNGVAVTRSVPLTLVNGVLFASVDLMPAASQSGGERMSVAVGGGWRKLWGVVTATDNATQAVTALWPQ
jgi:hypothetical protein